MTEQYVIHGEHGPELKRARDCVMMAYAEAMAAPMRPSGERFAEAVLARLGTLDPPMLVVALDEPDTAHGWGVWHSGDREWIGFGATNAIAAELIPEGPGYAHLQLRPVAATFVSEPAESAGARIRREGEEAREAVLESLRRGIDQAAAGLVQGYGDFTQYVDDPIEAERRRIWTAINAWEERGVRWTKEGGVETTDITHKPLDPFLDELRAMVFNNETAEQRIIRDYAGDQVLWHLINQLADEVGGIDGNVIRGWLDTTVREAVFADDPAVSSGAAGGEHPRTTDPKSDARRGGPGDRPGLASQEENVAVVMCTSGDHEDVPAVGDALTEEPDENRYPYCADCLWLLGPEYEPRLWEQNIPTIHDWVRVIKPGSAFLDRRGIVAGVYRDTPAGTTLDVAIEDGPTILVPADAVRVETRAVNEVIDAAFELVDAQIEGETEREADAWVALGSALDKLGRHGA
jgi:hypothetical protein